MNMTNKQAFSKAMARHFQTLRQYVPVVARVHGDNHPEFHEVKELFEAINTKIKKPGPAKPALNEEFARLREITNNYAVPDDACESYEAVYTMLAELDKAYQA
jgi:iron-sulfur cluster repair protein YtfE (RIC family)